MALTDTEHVQARMALVDEHVRCENRHDLEAVMATFGADARVITALSHPISMARAYLLRQ